MTARSARVIGIGLAAAAVAGSYASVRAGAAGRVDELARRATARRPPAGMDRFVGGATDLGSLYGLAGVVISLTAAGRHRSAVDVGVSGLAAWAAAQGAKPLLVRQRPFELGTATRLVAIPAGTSWPSGHAAVAAAMAVALSPRLGPGGRLLVWAAAGAVGVSRLHVGVHHLTDVVAGWGIGVLCAASWRALTGRWRSGHRQRQ